MIPKSVLIDYGLPIPVMEYSLMTIIYQLWIYYGISVGNNTFIVEFCETVSYLRIERKIR